AGLAVGADGLIIEVHPKPEEALVDGAQSLTVDMFRGFMESIEDNSLLINGK
ncbi:MAG: 3-deoxy-7-phosphoheptulonate synthase, partial [Candidatus Thorarchaeota archaeon]